MDSIENIISPLKANKGAKPYKMIIPFKNKSCLAMGMPVRSHCKEGPINRPPVHKNFPAVNIYWQVAAGLLH